MVEWLLLYLLICCLWCRCHCCHCCHWETFKVQSFNWKKTLRVKLLKI